MVAAAPGGLWAENSGDHVLLEEAAYEALESNRVAQAERLFRRVLKDQPESAAAIAGFFGLVGWPDLPPDGPWLAYTDTIGPRFITPTLLAAVVGWISMKVALFHSLAGLARRSLQNQKDGWINEPTKAGSAQRLD